MMRGTRTLVGAGVVALATATAPAATILLTDPVGDPASVTNVSPGGTFQFKTSLKLEPTDEALGVTFRLSASQSGIFKIVGRTIEPGNPFSTPIIANPAASSASPTLSPKNGVDLGSYTPDYSTRSGATYDLYTYIMQVSPDAPKGTYQIRAVGVEYSDGSFNTIAGDTSVYSVSVPEPVVFAALAVCSGGLLLRPRNRPLPIA